MIGFFRKDLLWVQTSLVLIAFPSSNCAASFFIEMLLVLERIGVFFFFIGPFLIVKELANVRNKLLGGDWHFSFVDRLWEIETSFGGRKRYYIFLCWCLCGMRVGRFPFGTLMATSFAIVNRLNNIYIYDEWIPQKEPSNPPLSSKPQIHDPTYYNSVGLTNL